jgi:hypothetical protein
MQVLEHVMDLKAYLSRAKEFARKMEFCYSQPMVYGSIIRYLIHLMPIGGGQLRGYGSY